MKSLKIHYLQHLEHEGLGMMERWFQDRGHQLTKTSFFEPAPFLPEMDEFHWLVILGGSMGVYEEGSYPWLREEIQFVKAVISAGKPVLGICLGAQLIAKALGGDVYSSGEKEIGWFPIQWTSQAFLQPWLKGAKEELTVFHWHGDTFDLPEGANLLASSRATERQGFVWGEKVIGLQFHLETDLPALQAFLGSGLEEWIEAGGAQSPQEALSLASYSRDTKAVMEALLSHQEAQA